MPTNPVAATTRPRRGHVARVDVVRYLLYLIGTATTVFLVGFVTTALGALVMVIALGGFGAVMLAREQDGNDPSVGSDAEGVFRWKEMRTSALACLPAVAVPAELSSPMASTVFFVLFAVPTYCVALANRAIVVRDRKRVGSGSTFGPPAAPSPLPPPGWYADPIDPRLVRWWDGWGWTLHWAAPWHERSGLE